jgi:hypothetical protein
MLRAAGKIAVAGIASLLAGCGPYNCGGPNGGHCYGTVSWGTADLGIPQFTNFGTVVTAVQLNGGNLVINDEMWVVQGPQACNSQCWVELGLTSVGAVSGGCSTTSDTRFFWAENTPNQTYLCHDLGPVQPQEFNNPTLLVINRRFDIPNTFDVTAETCTTIDGSPGGCTPRRVLTGESVNNPMTANTITLGMELGGTSGASAPRAIFTQNFWLAPFGRGVVFDFVSTPGNIQVNVPVAAGWATMPSTQTEGGAFFTSCCR